MKVIFAVVLTMFVAACDNKSSPPKPAPTSTPTSGSSGAK